MDTIFLVGPTAVGKTAVALTLAPRLDAEIVSADSMQIYRGMDIGTAKPTAAERATVPHHLIDVVDVSEPFDVAQYRRLALTAIADIHRRGKTALVVGGTGLYVRALTRGLDEMPQADAELRAQLEAQPLERLAAQLQTRDPLAAAKLDLKNKRRVVRALEVLELTGQSITAQQSRWTAEAASGESAHSITPTLHHSNAPPLIGLTRHRSDLYRRCDARVDEMFGRGLVDEVRALLARGLERNRTALQAVGYKEVVAHLRGETSLADCQQAVKLATRHLAKRQLTWFRREPNLTWVELSETETVEQTTQRVLDIIEKNRTEG
jgi:tRNA dimethylallyltransferase